MASYAIDASVFLNALKPIGAGPWGKPDPAGALAGTVASHHCPDLIASRVGCDGKPRPPGCRPGAQDHEEVSRIPNFRLMLVPLDLALARQAIDVAAEHRFRGCSSLSAVALRFQGLFLLLP